MFFTRQLEYIMKTHFGEEVDVAGNMVNPVGYQTVLYVTIVLYIISLALSMFFVEPSKAGKAVDVH